MKFLCRNCKANVERSTAPTECPKCHSQQIWEAPAPKGDRKDARQVEEATTLRLVEAVRRKDWHGANVLFTELLEDKAMRRLTLERQHAFQECAACGDDDHPNMHEDAPPEPKKDATKDMGPTGAGRVKRANALSKGRKLDKDGRFVPEEADDDPDHDPDEWEIDARMAERKGKEDAEDAEKDAEKQAADDIEEETGVHLREAYVDPNYKSKKEFKAAVLAGVQHQVYNPSGLFPTTQNGRTVVEGPHYPQPHRWYADCDVVNGIVTKVR
jgi:hypothetical protein